METAQRIEGRIRTMDNLLSVVRTMKNMAAINLRRLEAAAGALDEYDRITGYGWSIFFRDRSLPNPAEPDVEAVCVVFGSDQGMCGRFNEGVADMALVRLERLAEEGLGTVLWTVGDRALVGMEDRGRVVEKSFELPGAILSVDIRAGDILRAFEERQRAEGGARLLLLHNRLTDYGGYEPVQSIALPLDQDGISALKNNPWPKRNIPMAGLPGPELFRHLFKQSLFVSLYRAFFQSLAGENAARLTAMQAAENNIKEMREGLEAAFREERQTRITTELIEIFSGFEAMTSD